jgi:hypothetical protein
VTVASVPDPGGGLGHVVIGAQEIYNLCVELRSQGGEIRGDLRELKNTVDKIALEVEDHETRLRAVERRAWAIPSAATVIAMMALLVSAYAVFG